MKPLLKKISFRIKKLKRQPIFGGDEKRPRFFSGLWRYILIVVIGLLITTFVSLGRLPIRSRLNEGDIATEDVYAPFHFTYESGIDEDKTKKARKAASDGVLDIYIIDPTPLEETRLIISTFFDDFMTKKLESQGSLPQTMEKIDVGAVEEIKGVTSIPVTGPEFKALTLYPELESLKSQTVTIAEEIFSSPLVSAELKETLQSSKKKLIMIEGTVNGTMINQVAELASTADPHKLIDPFLSKLQIAQKDVRDILFKLVAACLKTNIVFSADATEAARKAASANAPPIYKVGRKIKGETIIRKGQRAAKEHLAQLAKIDISYGADDIVSQFWSVLVLVCLLGFLLLTYLKFFEPKIFMQDRMLLLIGLLILFSSVLSRIIVSSPLSSYFIPVATISILTALLISSSVAAIATTMAAVIAALTSGAKFNIFLVCMVGGITAVCTVYRARHRGEILKAGLYAGIASSIAICAIGILMGIELKIYLRDGLWGIANGITSSIIAMAFLPVFELLFKLTTDIKLLELSDLNHPLLKDMVMHATGTYHHSMVVGNLAEAACNVIGANPLLARVGAYYHDIGKIQKSEYFAENQRDVTDVHSSLTPSMSSLIITNHVKDGVELAERHKLGTAIKDIIEQHHGTSMVTYFYHQALEKTDEATQVSEEGFRYAGPKPQTKETAIVMFADSIEAASRVLQNPVPVHLKELVRKIINNKFIDGQLDECDLTLNDINKIADSFVRILTGIYHSRIEYPGDAQAKAANNKPRLKMK